MRHRLRNSFIYMISTCGVAWLYRKLNKQRGPLVRVITFHDVENREWFSQVIEMLLEEYNVLTPKQFYHKEFHSEKINILVTFDDGYQTWISTVLPVLDTHEVKAMFFVCSGLIEHAHDKEQTELFMKNRLSISPKPAIDWEGLRLLVQNGHTIGGHTVTHPNLAELQEQSFAKEIVKDKQVIERRLGIMLKDFAYPFGRKWHYTREIVDAVKNAGYLHAYTAETGFIMKTNHVHEIPRTLIEKNQPANLIRKWILGGYDIFVDLSKRI